MTMAQPDLRIIAETKLYSYGLEDAAHLARKVTRFLHLCSLHLADARHYNWGLRMLKSVLLEAGRNCDGITKAVPLTAGVMSDVVDIMPDVAGVMPDVADIMPDVLDVTSALVSAELSMTPALRLRGRVWGLGEAVSV